MSRALSGFCISAAVGSGRTKRRDRIKRDFIQQYFLGIHGGWLGEWSEAAGGDVVVGGGELRATKVAGLLLGLENKDISGRQVTARVPALRGIKLAFLSTAFLIIIYLVAVVSIILYRMMCSSPQIIQGALSLPATWPNARNYTEESQS